MKKPLLLPALLAWLLLSLLALAGCQRSGQPLEVVQVFPAAGAVDVPRDCVVEVTFSAPPGKLDEWFSVSPEMEGSFRYTDNAVAFIPSGRDGNDWQDETTYTVTLKAGLPAKEGKGVLAEDYSFSFTIQSGGFYPQVMSHRMETFLPQDYPVLDIRFGGKGSGGIAADEEFSVSVHRLENGERYLKELYRAIAGNAVRVDTTGLPEILTFTQGAAEMQDPENQWDADIVFPETLPEGWYVATVTSNHLSRPVQKLLQIQESAVYTQLNAGEALVWANSTKTQKPLSGATLKLYKDPFASMAPDLTVQGDGDGVFLFDLPEVDREEAKDGWPRGEYGRAGFPCSITGPDGTAYYDVLYSDNLDKEKSLQQNYYGFLYLDRPIYHQSDTVKFWGVARPRKDAPKLDKVEVGLYQNWGEEAALKVEAPVNAGGVFTGEFSYQSLKSGWFSVRAYPAGMEREKDSYYETICREDAQISQYKKPICTGSITTDKLYYQPGEEVRTEVAVSLFDRTPAAGVKMTVYPERAAEQSFTTDQNGLIRFAFPALIYREGTDWGWYPQTYGITATGNTASDVDLSFRKYVYVFPTTIMMEAEEQRHNGRSDLVITANHIDFEKVPQNGQLIQDYESLRGLPAQAHVTVALHRVTYTKIPMAPYYDRYTKKSIPRSTYHRTDFVDKTLSQTTGADGRLVLSDLIPHDLGEHDYCYAEITTNSGGYQSTQLVLGAPWRISPEERAGHFHTFQAQGEGDRSENPWYSYWGSSFNFGETLRYQVMDNGLPVEGGQVLTNYLQNKVLGRPQLRGTQGEIPCTEEKLPNFTLCGAYFDGTRIYPVKPLFLSVREKSRQLDLQVLPEREDYRPGDTAQVTLRLTEDGKPVSGGNVCLGVVDEAVFAVQEQYLNLGWNLYRSVFYDYPTFYCSYVQHGVDLYYGDGGKGGGGGGDGVSLREKFEDTAAFLTGVTGADGAARFTVKLPDNLTEWRLTALALDSRAYWGQTKSRLYTSLPFRIDPILSSVFLSGDTIACTVRGFGREIQTTDLVEYTASIEGYGDPLEVTAQAAAGEIIPLVFQKLPPGEYAITVTARCGEYSDGVRVPFTVRDSALTFPIHKTFDLGEGIGPEVQPTHYPVEVQIYNEGQKSFMNAWSLLSQDASGRADAALATESVREAMTAFFGEGYTHPETDLSNVQVPLDDPDGKGFQGVRLYPYAEADLETSAWAAVTVPHLLDLDQLGGYFRETERKKITDPQKAAVLMGLAALDQLDTSQEVYLRTRAQNSGLPALESVYLIAGLSYLDQQEAQKLYSQIIAPRYKELRGGLYLPENTAYKTTESTAGAMACAILAGVPDDAEKLLTYLADNARTFYGTMRGPCQLQAALYIRRFQLKDSDLPTVRYTLDGERKSVALPRSGCLRFTLSKEAWEAFAPQAEGGPAIASVTYTGSPDQLELADSPRITVTKTMDTPEDQKHLGGVTTVTIQAELSPELPYGSYRLVEWVPSNMRLRKVSRNSRDWFSYRTDEQLLTVDFYYGPNSGRTFTLSYTAASVLDTECVLERAYIYHGETMECGRTEKGEFLPSDYYYLGVGYLFRKEQ